MRTELGRARADDARSHERTLANKSVKRTRSSHRLGCSLGGRAAYAQRWAYPSWTRVKSWTRR